MILQERIHLEESIQGGKWKTRIRSLQGLFDRIQASLEKAGQGEELLAARMEIYAQAGRLED